MMFYDLLRKCRAWGQIKRGKKSRWIARRDSFFLLILTHYDSVTIIRDHVP